MRKVSPADQVASTEPLARAEAPAQAAASTGPVLQSLRYLDAEPRSGARMSPAARKLMAAVAMPGITVPDGAEAMTERDIKRLIPRVVQLESTRAKLPAKIPVSRSQVADLLPFLLSQDARYRAAFDRQDGRDYLLIAGKMGDPVGKVELASEPRGPGRHSPLGRIAQIARTAPADKPLLGLRVALDPGHFGDIEDMREGKWVTYGPPPTNPETVPADGLTEGDLNAIAARNLARRLTSLGAEVVITRQGRVTRTNNRAYVNALLDADPELAKRAGNRASFLSALDLERRAERIGAHHPDISIVMHFDAEVHQVSPKARHEVKIYVPGCFSVDSLESKMGQARFVQQCASTSWNASAELAATLVKSICKATGAVPQVPGKTGEVNPKFLLPVGKDTGVFARSLRLPHAVPGEPLSVYLEGATYNHPDVFPLVFRDRGTTYGQPGGFLDTYARSLVEGLVAYVRSQR